MVQRKGMSRPFSTKNCSVKNCRKTIKEHILLHNPEADLCYAHYQELVRNNPRFRGGKRIPSKTQPEDLVDEE